MKQSLETIRISYSVMHGTVRNAIDMMHNHNGYTLDRNFNNNWIYGQSFTLRFRKNKSIVDVVIGDENCMFNGQNIPDVADTLKVIDVKFVN